MSEKTRANSSDAPENTQSRPTVATLGLIPAPELPEEIAGDLPEMLSRSVDDRVRWEVSMICDPLTGDGRDAPEILDVCRDRVEEEGWDLAVCLTDLPVYRGGRLIVADASLRRKVAGISLPALGITGSRRKVREAILQLVCELRAGSDLPGETPDCLVSRRFAEFVIPIKRIAPPDEGMREMDVDV